MELYCDVTNCTGVINIIVSTNHDSPVSVATIDTISTTLTLGDLVTVDLGYVDDHAIVFTGYVKQIEKKIPDNVFTITAYDVLMRAQDYFIASSNPNEPLSYKGITAEDLVGDLLSKAGLTDYENTPTYFTFGINNSFEINLVSVFDYCRNIADTITWTLWADQDGTINFKNRKPYVMTGDTGQPGDVADVPTGYQITAFKTIDFSYTKSERSLRNRVVVYGAEGIYAEASESSSMLPPGFYKSSVLALPQLIDNQSLAQDIANYNLDLQNRINESLSVTVRGDSSLSCRTVITNMLGTLFSGITGLSGSWYVFGCDHQWGKTGYTTSLDLRRMSRY